MVMYVAVRMANVYVLQTSISELTERSRFVRPTQKTGENSE